MNYKSVEINAFEKMKYVEPKTKKRTINKKVIELSKKQKTLQSFIKDNNSK